MEAFDKIVNTLYKLVWEFPSVMPYMVLLLLGTGVFMTIRLKFIQIRAFKHSWGVITGMYDDPKDAGDINHFQALTSALSATVGIGNIAGVAIAIHYGGPGALFWMWVTAIFGMTLKFTECTLAMRYREVHEDGSVSGGPFYYIQKGLGGRWKWLAIVVATMTFICSFGTGNANQSFTVADQVRSSFPFVPTWLTGVVTGSLVALVIIGGIKRIGAVTSRLVPIMCVLYVLSALLVLAMNVHEIPHAFALIVSGAFSPQGAVGGFAGSTFMYTLLWGVKRGLFSNEAGQGSAPIAHAAAKTKEPVREGIVALIEPFVDTLTICTMTGLVIVITGTWNEKKQETIPFDVQQEIAIVRSGADILVEGKYSDVDLFEGSFEVRDGVASGVEFFQNEGTVEEARLYWKSGVGDSDEGIAVGDPFSGTIEVALDGGREGQVLAGASADGTPISFALVSSSLVLEGKILQHSSPLTAWAFERGLSPLFPGGRFLVTLAVVLFGVSTAISWSYYGDRAIRFLFGPRMVFPYKIMYCGVYMFAATQPLEAVWTFGDTALGLMAIPNLIAILFLSNVTARLTRDYMSREHVRYR
jgi:AGCS family alanine or glycine:cation symporter